MQKVLDRLDPEPASPGERQRSFDQPYHAVEQHEGIQRLLRLIAFLFEENHPDRDTLIDLNVQQLIVRLLRTSARPLLANGHSRHTAEGGLAAAVERARRFDDEVMIEGKDGRVEQACEKAEVNVSALEVLSSRFGVVSRS